MNNKIYIDGFIKYSKNAVQIDFSYNNKRDWCICSSYNDFKNYLRYIYNLNIRLNYYYLTGCKDGLYQYDKISTAEIQSYFNY